MKDKIKPSEEVNIPNGQVDKEEPFQSLTDPKQMDIFDVIENEHPYVTGLRKCIISNLKILTPKNYHKNMEKYPEHKLSEEELLKIEESQRNGSRYNYPPKKRGYCGIDNGVSGSIGIIYEDGTYKFFKIPVKSAQDYTKAKKNVNRVQPIELINILSKLSKESMILIERPMVNSTRFNASLSAIRCYEATITVLDTLELPYAIVDSKEWQKELLPKGISGDELKKASLDVGNRLFPVTKTVKHADCDGMLIAQYCKLKYR